MESNILQTIEKYKMLTRGDTVVAGVSGGADSMCLLHFLCALRQEYGLTVIAAHINHGLRGEEAERDEEFVRRWCTSHNIPFECRRADIKSLAAQRSLGLEACGREVRYAFFSELARRYGAKIATAHTASDNAETVLFHLARGTGLKGLCGIPPVRENVIRPLIETTREQVEAYCKENNLAFVTDSTNLEDGYTRNKLRHQVIPVLKGINPGFEQAVLRMSVALSQDDGYLFEQARAALKQAERESGIYDCEELSKAPAPVLSRAVQLCAQDMGCRLEQTHIVSVCGIVHAKSGACDLPCGLRAAASQGKLRVIRQQQPVEKWEIPLSKAGFLMKYNKKITWTLCAKNDYDKKTEFNKMLLNNALDYDIISRNSAFRCRREGDVFAPAGRNLSKTVKKLFNEYKIPLEQRGRVILLAQGGGVLWIDGFGVSRHAAVSEKTKHVLIITTETAGD